MATQGTHIELRRVADGVTTFFRARRRGKTVETQTWRQGCKPRGTSKWFDKRARALQGFDRVVGAKLRQGYVELNEAPGRGPAVIFRAAGHLFDIGRDGVQLVAAATKPRADGFRIRLYDTRTGGHRELVDANAPAGHQLFLHAVWLDATGEHVIYAVDGRTIRRHITTGKESELASYEEYRNARFNPFVVRPTFDAARRRLLVFDRGDQVRVLDAAGTRIFSCKGNTATADTWAATLSPSGTRLVLYVASRHIVYGHADAANDQTHELRVYDVDSGKLLHTHPCDEPIDDLAPGPNDGTLLEWRDVAIGPVLVDLATRRQRRRFIPSRLEDSRSVSYSPDGRWLAIGSGRLYLLNVRTRAEHDLDEDHPYYLNTPIVWTADSTRLATRSGSAIVVIRL